MSTDDLMFAIHGMPKNIIAAYVDAKKRHERETMKELSNFRSFRMEEDPFIVKLQQELNSPELLNLSYFSDQFFWLMVSSAHTLKALGGVEGYKSPIDIDIYDDYNRKRYQYAMQGKHTAIPVRSVPEKIRSVTVEEIAFIHVLMLWYAGGAEIKSGCRNEGAVKYIADWLSTIPHDITEDGEEGVYYYARHVFQHLYEDHAFVDGNKRTAVAVMQYICIINNVTPMVLDELLTPHSKLEFYGDDSDLHYDWHLTSLEAPHRPYFIQWLFTPNTGKLTDRLIEAV